MHFKNTSLNFNGTSNFIDNSAYDGGAICATYNAYLNFTGTSNSSTTQQTMVVAVQLMQSTTHCWVSQELPTSSRTQQPPSGGVIHVLTLH